MPGWLLRTRRTTPLVSLSALTYACLARRTKKSDPHVFLRTKYSPTSSLRRTTTTPTAYATPRVRDLSLCRRSPYACGIKFGPMTVAQAHVFPISATNFAKHTFEEGFEPMTIQPSSFLCSLGRSAVGTPVVYCHYRSSSTTPQTIPETLVAYTGRCVRLRSIIYHHPHTVHQLNLTFFLRPPHTTVGQGRQISVTPFIPFFGPHAFARPHTHTRPRAHTHPRLPPVSAASHCDIAPQSVL
jgi:hypothetical protein